MCEHQAASPQRVSAACVIALLCVRPQDPAEACSTGRDPSTGDHDHDIPLGLQATVRCMLLQEFPIATGRVVRRSHLISLGYSHNDIRSAVRRDGIVRVRHGWYAHPDAHPAVLAVSRSGAVVSCVSALSHHGVWSPVSFDRGHTVHSRRTEHRDRRRLPIQAGVHICRLAERDARPCPAAIDGIDDALISASRCQSRQWLTVLLDSALHLRLRTRSELASLARGADDGLQRALLAATGLSESGTESMTMLGLRRRRLKFRQQVRIGRHRVDFLIGDRLIVEVDGKEFHHLPDTFEADRLRDRALTAAGYIVIRLTYRQVMRALEEALDDICRVVARGDHRF